MGKKKVGDSSAGREPKSMSALQDPASQANLVQDGDIPDDKIRLQKELGLMDGVAMIVGVIIGSGIFVSPIGVLMNAGSTGLALFVWVMSGALSMIGALCYAELGTMIPKSGGDYAYINEAFGPLPAFLYMWVALFVIMPTGNAVTALTFAQYILQPIWPHCDPPYGAVRLLAAVITCLLTAINCYNVKWVTRLQDVFTATKMLALGGIVLAGLWFLLTGHTENIAHPMQDSNWDPGYIALAFYSGLFSYSGWNYLNFVTEELKNPYKNLPKAICISMPLSTIVYLLVNVAYFVVLSKEELLSSNTVAVTFGTKMFNMFTWMMPLFVSCSTFGALNGAIFASSRLFFVGARNGHLPKAIALINVKRYTPCPSLVFLCIITLCLMCIDDVFALINYATFVESSFTLTSVTGLLWLRYKQPDLKRPIKVNIILPVTFFVIAAFLVTLPMYVKPWEVGVGLLMILSGIPVYLIFVFWQDKPRWIDNIADKMNMACAKLFMCVLEDTA